MSRGTCLVIENDEDIAGLITVILAQQGFDVRAVRTGAAALRHASGLNPALIILEAILPDTNGLNIVRDLKNITQAPLIMLTARAEADDEFKGLAAGASIYLTKPFRISDLRSAANVLCPSRVDSMSVRAGWRNKAKQPGAQSGLLTAGM